MLTHIVFFKLQGQANGLSKAEVAARMKRDFEALRDVVPGAHTIDVGLNVSSADVAWDVALYSVFTDAAALQAYQRHPRHQEIVAFLDPYRTARAVVDYAS